MALTIGIALGDITGIGPEVTLKAVAAELEADDTRYVLVGAADRTRELNRRFGLGIPFREASLNQGATRVSLVDPLPIPLPADLPPGSPAAARAAIDYLRAGAQR